MSAHPNEEIIDEFETASFWFKQMEAAPTGAMLDEQRAEIRVRFNRAYAAFRTAGSPSRPAPPPAPKPKRKRTQEPVATSASLPPNEAPSQVAAPAETGHGKTIAVTGQR